ncbi:MAG: hypothetical protein ACRCTQ_03130 [Brevinemataceae bacterium]
MRLIFNLFLLCSSIFVLFSCAGEQYLLGGPQICAVWNGVYYQYNTGSAYLNIGIKNVDIINVSSIPNNDYSLHSVVAQNHSILQVWLYAPCGYVAFQMTRAVPGQNPSILYVNPPIPSVTEFPQNFNQQLTMLQQ